MEAGLKMKDSMLQALILCVFKLYTHECWAGRFRVCKEEADMTIHMENTH